MGMKPVEILWTVNVVKQHQVTVKRTAGSFTDTLSVTVDGQQVYSGPAGGFSANRGRHQFMLDERPVELRWVWSDMTGDPAALVLMQGETVLASSGTPEQIARASSPDFQTGGFRGWAVGAIIAVLLVVLSGVALWSFVLKSTVKAIEDQSAVLLERTIRLPATNKYQTTFNAPRDTWAEVTIVTDDTVYITLIDPRGNKLIDDKKIESGGKTSTVRLEVPGTFTVWLHNINLFEGKFVQLRVRETKNPRLTEEEELKKLREDLEKLK